MTDALEDYEGAVIIGGRHFTNLRFADDKDGFTVNEHKLVRLIDRPHKNMVWKSAQTKQRS